MKSRQELHCAWLLRCSRMEGKVMPAFSANEGKERLSLAWSQRCSTSTTGVATAWASLSLWMACRRSLSFWSLRWLKRRIPRGTFDRVDLEDLGFLGVDLVGVDFIKYLKIS